MPGKMVPCPHCSKIMRSDNLKNHVKRHGRVVETSNFTAQQKRPRSSDILVFDERFAVKRPFETFHGSDKLPKNPKIQALVNEIINESSTEKPLPRERTQVLPQKPAAAAAAGVLPIPSPEIVDEVFQEIVLPPPPGVVAEMFQYKSPPRTKGDIIDYSDNDDDGSCSDDDDVSHDEAINIHELPPPDIVKFLPTTIEGLRVSFEELIKNIAIDRKSGRYEKTGNRNEAVFLLDELKRQGGISRRMYRQYNNFLVVSRRRC
jgi:hypothetical protein